MSQFQNKDKMKLKDLTIIMIDNFDSFTYNLVNQLKTFVKDVKVYRNDISVSEILAIFELSKNDMMLVISPGPGSPKTAGNILQLLSVMKGKYPILGVCLGHQAIIESYGGKIGHAKSVVHGKSHLLNVAKAGEKLFEGITPFSAARYHSLSASKTPNVLEVLATCEDEIMIVSHKDEKTIGLQFHPESILTPNGSELTRRLLIQLTN